MENMDKPREELMNDVHNESNLFTPGNDFNEKYEGRLKYVDNHPKLTPEEKFLLKRRITSNKDARNILDYRGPKYPCSTKTCDRYGYTVGVCEHCYRDAFKRNFATWTSGNAGIDEAIKAAQTRVPLPRTIVEWIEYEKLQNIKRFKKGGCAIIYSAEWTEGSLESIDVTTHTFHRSKPKKVILKRFKNSADPDYTFLHELKTHIMLDTSSLLVVKVFGISKFPETGEFILIMEEMDYDLKTYVQKHGDKLTWKEIYTMFWFAITALEGMHNEKNVLHRDLHYGNLLRRYSGTWYISDFGLSGKAKNPKGNIYGILDFTPPEVLRGEEYNPKGDIYSLGMLMYFAVTGRTYEAKEGPGILTHEIKKGKRPPIPEEIPKLYKNIIKRCWDNNPAKRPEASELSKLFTQLSKEAAENDEIGLKLVFGGKVPNIKMSELPRSSFLGFNLPDQQTLEIKSGFQPGSGDLNLTLGSDDMGSTSISSTCGVLGVLETPPVTSIQLKNREKFSKSPNPKILIFLFSFISLLTLYKLAREYCTS